MVECSVGEDWKVLVCPRKVPKGKKENQESSQLTHESGHFMHYSRLDVIGGDSTWLWFLCLFCVVVHFFQLVNVCFCCVRFIFFIPNQEIGLGDISEMTCFALSGA